MHARTARFGLADRIDVIEGDFVVVDVMSADTPELHRAFAAYALYLALRVGGACPHSEPLLREWLGAAGLGRARRIDLESGPRGLSALIAQR